VRYIKGKRAGKGRVAAARRRGCFEVLSGAPQIRVDSASEPTNLQKQLASNTFYEIRH